MDTRASTRTRLSVLPVFIAFLLNVFLVAPVAPLAATPAGPSTAYADSHVTVTLEDGVAGCMGVRTTPGSENTTKELVGGTLEPGGTAIFRFTFPAETSGNPGQEEWKLTDCVFLNDAPIQKYTVTAFENDVSPVEIEFALTIPSDAPIGSEYCNYAKTTETPSDAQASNRKAGPACFIVGGAIRVLKVDEAQNPLAGATFAVTCDWPNVSDGTFLPDTVLTATPNGSINGGGASETINSVDDGSFSRTVVTGSDGAIGVNGPDGTVCTFTETAAPGGYLPPAPPANSVTLTIDGGGAQATHTFVNTRALPNVVLAKSASHTTVLAPFSNLVFTLTASNIGNAPATGVSVSDQIDTDLIIVSATWDNDPGTAGNTGACDVTAGNLVTCNVGDLAASDGDTTGAEPDVATATITVNVPLAACPAIANFGTVSATNEGTAEAGDNTSNTVNVTVNCPDASVQKSATSPIILGGETAEFQITVDGGTVGTASDVTLTDTVPAGYSWTVDGDVEDCGLTDGAVLAGGTLLSCNFGPLGPSALKTITVAASTSLESCGATITNTATIAADGDTEAGNNSSTASITVECPDVAIDKSASSLTVLAPDTIVYELLVTNEGDATADGVVISDDLDDDLTIVGNVEYDLGDDGTADGTCSVSAGNVISCDVGDLASGAMVSVTITVQIPTDACADDLTNTASVAANNEPAGLDGNNHDTVDVAVDCPDVSVEKTATDPVISSTEAASFSITVDGGALGTASDVTLTDELPAGFNWTASGDVEDCGLDDGDLLAGGSTISCNFGPLDPNEQKTMTLSAETLATTCDLTISNTAVVSADGDTDLDNNWSTATVRVECPELEINKEANADRVSAGEPISFWITVGNAGDGTAFDAMLSDALPNGDGIDWSIAEMWVKGSQVDEAAFGEYCSLSAAPDQELDCDFGDLATSEGAALKIASETDADSCAAYQNVALTSAANHAEVESVTASVIVECPGLNIVKTADDDSIVAGEEASFTITIWNEGPGTAHDVEFEDELPAGLDWSFELLDGFDPVSCESSADESGTLGISCSLGDLADEQEVRIRVFADTDRSDCGSLENLAWAQASNNDRVGEGAEIDVSCPTLTIDKEADADLVVISGPAGDLEADPAVVTWTLSYTLTDGPVTNAVISDELPTGLIYVEGSASDGGVHDAASNTLTWTFATLSESGSVTFETAVDPETISRVAPTENVAVISSDQTPEDEGQDEVAVTVEQELGGNPTPAPTPEPRLPDTAIGFGPGGEPITVPVELMAVVFLGSLGGLALANVRAARGRRR